MPRHIPSRSNRYIVRASGTGVGPLSGTDCYGGDITNTTSASAADCASLCTNDPSGKCTVYTYTSSNKNCALKTTNAFYNQRANPDRVCGYVGGASPPLPPPGTQAMNTDCYGSDVTSVKNVGNLDACKSACQSNTLCAVYTYEPNEQTCLLKGVGAWYQQQPNSERICGYLGGGGTAPPEGTSWTSVGGGYIPPANAPTSSAWTGVGGGYVPSSTSSTAVGGGYKSNKPPTKKKNLGMIIGLSVLGLVLIGGLLFYVVRSRRTSKPTSLKIATPPSDVDSNGAPPLPSPPSTAAGPESSSWFGAF